MGALLHPAPPLEPAADSPPPEPRSPEDPASPRGLLRRFAILSVGSVLAILVLVGAGIHGIYRDGLIESAQANAVAVAEVIFARERPVLLAASPAGASRIAVAPKDFAGLDERMRGYLAPFGIVKIKVYDAGQVIAYSTDASIVGKHDANNPKLERVLREGVLDSKLVKKEKVADLHGQDRFLVDVVETYLPIRVGEAIVGSFEVYVDVSPAYERIVHAVKLSVSVLFMVLLFVFASLYFLMRAGTTRLEDVQARLRDMACTDGLTGLLNRRHLFTRIGEEVRRMDRDRRRNVRADHLGFILADIDHFKSINDTHGHQAGDEVLREVSARLKACLRAYDVIGRYGGEEFLVMLPHADLSSATLVAERMRRAVADTPVALDNGPLRVTASFGVAQTGDDADDAKAVIRRADEGLYRAKAEGRDRVVALAAGEA